MPMYMCTVSYSVCQDSLTKHSPVPMDSTGRSGARFWLSHDRLFVIKLIGSEDVIEMHRILQDYHQVNILQYVCVSIHSNDKIDIVMHR